MRKIVSPGTVPSNTTNGIAVRGQSPFGGDSPLFSLLVLITGAGGIIAQVILLRELLVGFYGNELTIGVILANWVIAEAIGVSIGGWLAEKTKNKSNLFTILTASFSIVLPAAIYLSRIFKPLLGIPFGEGVGLPAILLVSFFVLLPAAFCHGALFNCGTNILSSLGRMYAWETIGTVAGGLIITYAFLPFVNSFLAVFIIGFAGLVSCFLLWRSLAKILKVILLMLCCFMIFLFLSGEIDHLQRNSIAKQWQKENVLSYRNSLYGNIVVTKQPGQLTFFYNGTPIIVSPHPDITFVEEFGNLPLLFHPHPKDILLISGGAGGLINEILKHPDVRIDYTELDPMIIEAVKNNPDELTAKELHSPRVNIIKMDGIFFLRNGRRQYDVIFIGISRISDLTENRFFTQEFFSLAKEHLNPGGILALRLAGSLAYLSQDLKDVNASVLNSLTVSYPFVRIIPGDSNMFFASANRDILQASPSLIAERASTRGITTNLLVLTYLQYRLDPWKVIWFHKSLAGATTRLNQDLRPYAVFKALVLWNKQFSPRLAGFLDSLEKIGLLQVAIAILLLTFILFLILRKLKQRVKLALSLSIFTTGFFGMLITLMLTFSFQVFTGYLYHKIGLLVSIFMAGSAAGSLLIIKNTHAAKHAEVLFIGLELFIVNFTLLCAGIIYLMAQHGLLGFPIFSALFFISGLLLGLEFPLAGRIYLGEKAGLGEACGALYAADLLGGWLAGIAAGVFFLPILGIFATCLVVALLKLSSLLLFISSLKAYD
ncbi:MAG: spermine synthase [Candidatus Omnitrophica bacterium]|nr:spermine synthase [Candidatus Omnitrophota bacterium]